jgi:hypothetical protein
MKSHKHGMNKNNIAQKNKESKKNFESLKFR